MGVAVLPGDDVTDLILAMLRKQQGEEGDDAGAAGGGGARIGVGLQQVAEGGDARAGCIVAVRAGRLLFQPPTTFWVDTNQRRYVAAVNDTVVGVVTERNAAEYKVALCGGSAAVLPLLAFQGASKRNRPALTEGSLVYARVVIAHPELEPELSCQAPAGVVSKDWVTGESVYGPLSGGHVLRTSHGLARQLLHPSCAVLEALGAVMPFEIAVGANGVVWVKAATTRETLIAAAAIQSSEHLSDAQRHALVRRLVAADRGGDGER